MALFDDIKLAVNKSTEIFVGKEPKSYECE